MCNGALCNCNGAPVWWRVGGAGCLKPHFPAPQRVWGSVADLERFDADPDQDPFFQADADPDPDPNPFTRVRNFFSNLHLLFPKSSKTCHV